MAGSEPDAMMRAGAAFDISLFQRRRLGSLISEDDRSVREVHDFSVSVRLSP